MTGHSRGRRGAFVRRTPNLGDVVIVYAAAGGATRQDRPRRLSRKRSFATPSCRLNVSQRFSLGATISARSSRCRRRTTSSRACHARQSGAALIVLNGKLPSADSHPIAVALRCAVAARSAQACTIGSANGTLSSSSWLNDSLDRSVRPRCGFPILLTFGATVWD
jgi:hypothetical protein